jgi:hypothetical protein
MENELLGKKLDEAEQKANMVNEKRIISQIILLDY